jgi:hypothetical protein
LAGWGCCAVAARRPEREHRREFRETAGIPLGELPAIARRLPGTVLACFALTRKGAALEALRQRLTACREARAQVSAQMAPGREQSDLQDLRQRFASTGGGLFSFLNGTYRRSRRCRAVSPPA